MKLSFLCIWVFVSLTLEGEACRFRLFRALLYRRGLCFAGDFAAISALRAAAARRLRSEPPRGPSLGPSDQFTLSRLRAQCGRRVLPPSFCRARRLGRRLTGFRPVGRVSFPAMGKKPMAQATRSYPFGAIHLEDRRGTAPDERFVLIVASPTPSGPSGHLPLTGGVGPGPPLRETHT